MIKQKVALVLGSGGARGAAHIGVIRELIDQGYEISSISGSSMGALIGGVYAAGKLDEYESWLTSLSRIDIFNLVDFTLSNHGIIKTDKVLKEIESFVSDRKIEDLPIKFAAVATDLNNKKEVVITEGSLFEAIRASISIPMVVTPLKKNDTLFVDGGVLNPVPVNRVARQENDILVAVNVNSLIPPSKPLPTDSQLKQFNRLRSNKLRRFQRRITRLFPLNNKQSVGYFHLINDTTGLMLSQITKLTLESCPPDILIEISRQSYGTFDFYKAKELIALGKEVTRKRLLQTNTDKIEQNQVKTY